MISGLHVDSAPRCANGGLEDRAALHLRDLRKCDAEPAAAMPEHWIGLAQRLDDAGELRTRESESAREQLRSPRRHAEETHAAGDREGGS